MSDQPRCQQCGVALSSELQRRGAKVCTSSVCRKARAVAWKIANNPTTLRLPVPCAICGNPIPPRRNVRQVAKYCSTSCVDKGRSRTHFAVFGTQLSTGTIGTIGELVVAADLMRRGYEVFRALSPACSSDLIILVGCRAIRIEVRTGYTTTKGVSWSREKFRADVFAVVLHDSSPVIYEPSLESLTTAPSSQEQPSIPDQTG